ncbi:hypothetical protein IMSHALPRED_005490 [Imshaugia aleurites]|uniref:BTB domain-containing protein n=1 Tax=Imshaugia aleurites TaxID=172621 RepID=A0A8H3I714_9LECA|nr:hypothetical protein IMSHALPRED_005490 [Imshaugia aleurites]
MSDHAKITAQAQFAMGPARLFNSGDYFDLTVKCVDHEWKVHRAVLCPRSKFFTNACKDGFQEGISHVIELKEDDPALLNELLTACYRCDYDDTVSGNNKLDFNARMYALADKYDIPFLKELSKDMFRAQLIQVQLNGVMDIPLFLSAVRTIYTTTLGSDRSLRDLLVPVLEEHSSTLNQDDRFLDLLRSNLGDGDFAVDVIATMSQLLKPKPPLVYWCIQCNQYAANANSGSAVYCSRWNCKEYMGEVKQP